jgi:hypothetical protein
MKCHVGDDFRSKSSYLITSSRGWAIKWSKLDGWLVTKLSSTTTSCSSCRSSSTRWAPRKPVPCNVISSFVPVLVTMIDYDAPTPVTSIFIGSSQVILDRRCSEGDDRYAWMFSRLKQKNQLTNQILFACWQKWQEAFDNICQLLATRPRMCNMTVRISPNAIWAVQ